MLKILKLQFVYDLCLCISTKSAKKMKINEFENSVDPDEAAQNEPPHLGLHCWFSISRILKV